MSSLPGEIYRRSAPVPLSPRHAHAGELMKRLGEPLIGGNRVALLEDAAAAFEALCRAIDGARDHVNIEGALVQADAAGEAIARQLADRCADGVRVNLLFDGAGSLSAASPVFARLRRSGVSLCAYAAAPRWRTLAGLALPPGEHRRLMVVDGRVGFVAGGGPRGAGGRDLQVQVEGPVVQRLQRLFIAHWQHHAAAPMQQARYFRPLSPVGTHRVGVVASDAAGRRDPACSALLGAIDTATQRVLLACAEPVPPHRLLGKLVRAAGRGVAVELLVPRAADAWPLSTAGRAPIARLLQAGVRIHEQPGPPRHASACVIDGVWSSIGEASADWRRLLHEAEARVVVLDEDFAARLEAVLRADAAGADALDAAAWRRRSAWNRLREAVARHLEALS